MKLLMVLFYIRNSHSIIKYTLIYLNNSYINPNPLYTGEFVALFLIDKHYQNALALSINFFEGILILK